MQDVPVEVDIRIAIVGKIGSGRSSFVNAIRGYVIRSINFALLLPSLHPMIVVI